MSFADCNFQVKKGRDGTGRVVVSKELGIQNAYTLEATFCGADFGPLKDVHFNQTHLAESGRALIDTLLDYYMPNPMQREKAANLLKQASERKAARDRSERMAAARAAMQSVRAEQGLGKSSTGAGHGDSLEKEIEQSGQNGAGAGGGGATVSGHQQKLSSGSTIGRSGSARFNGFMIESGARRSSASSLQQGTIASAASGRMRPFGGGLDTSNGRLGRGGISVINNGWSERTTNERISNERNSNSAEGGGRRVDRFRSASTREVRRQRVGDRLSQEMSPLLYDVRG